MWFVVWCRRRVRVRSEREPPIIRRRNSSGGTVITVDPRRSAVVDEFEMRPFPANSK